MNIEAPRFQPLPCSRLQLGSQLCDTQFQLGWDSLTHSQLNFYRQPFPIKVQFEMQRSCINIFFYSGTKFYKALLSLDTMRGGMLSVVDNGADRVFTLVVERNPMLWVGLDADPLRPVGSPWSVRRWVRVVDLEGADQEPGAVASPLRLGMGDGLKLGDCNVWQFRIPKLLNQLNTNHQKELDEAIDLLVRYKLAKFDQQIPLIGITDSNKKINIPNDVTFTRLYLLDCLLSNNLISKLSINPALFDILIQFRRSHLYQAIERIWSQSKFINDLSLHLQQEFTRPSLTLSQDTPNIDTHCLVRKVIVTPTKLYVLPPTLEESNRVLRNYHQVRIGSCA